MREFLESAANQNHPLRILKDFLDDEEKLENAGKHDSRRLIGYRDRCIAAMTRVYA
ncbi:hypothetical protein ACFL6S_16775 [Candidatus Poribacteria bacterium]